MKAYLFSIKAFLIPCLSIISLGLKCYAQQDHFIQTLEGTSFHVDSTCFVQDDKFNTIYWNDIDTTLFVKNVITVELNHDAEWVLNRNFIDSVTVQLICVDKDSLIDTVNASFVVTHDTLPGSSFNFRSVYYLYGKHQVLAKITYKGVYPASLSNAINSLPVLRLKNEIYISRLFDFDCSDLPIVDYVYIPDKDKLNISWTPVDGNTEYDLEWTFYDDSSDVVKNFANYTFDNLFKNNASRISTKDNNYLVSLIYPSGFLFFRARAVKIDAHENRLVGEWSEDGIYAVLWHEDKLNWQYNASFAEDGKRKELISYYDGSLRNRQQVTQMSSNQTTIVGEKIYDKEGRAVIDIMPVPAIRDSTDFYDPKMHYYDDFNKNAAGFGFSSDDIDTAFCSGKADSMSTMSGASLYYSRDNPDSIVGFQKFTPDAEGYPYAITVFTQDNTGRIFKKGNVGKEMQPGNHETTFLYAKPGQEELDRMFGNDAGHASHYTKDAIVDPNGQVSVTYKDLQQRVVATALSGVTPANLIELPNKPAVTTITKNLLDNVIKNSPTISSSYSLLVTEQTNYHFVYKLFPQSLVNDNCDTVEICYDCLYNMTIRIESLCGNIYADRLSNYSFGDYDTLCENSPVNIVDSFDIELDLGTYNITQVISISSEAADFYANKYLNENTCKTFEEFYDEKIAETDFSGCNFTCDSCNAQLGTDSSFFEHNYMQLLIDKGMTPVAEDTIQALASYKAMQDFCKDLCSPVVDRCTQKEMLLRSDMSPGGQYAKYIPNEVTGIYSPADTASIFAVTGPFYYGNMTWEIGGVPITVMVGDTTYSPGNLSVKDFIQNWNDNWSSVLYHYHPEKCYLNFCNTMSASNTFDNNMLMTETYQQAYDSGYFNTLTDVMDTFPTNGTADPFFVIFSTTYAAPMHADMYDYPYFMSLCQRSIWDLGMLISQQSTDSCGSIPSLSHACTGDLNFFWKAYRAMYLSLKEIQFAEAEEVWVKNHCIVGVNPCNKCIGCDLPNFNAMGQDCADCATGALYCGTTWGNYFKLKTPRFFHVLKTSQAISNFNSVANANTYVDTSLISSCQSQCESYSVTWMDLLSNCSNYSGVASWPSDSAELAHRLIAICRAGCDLSHPLGSSTVKPGTFSSGYFDVSFQQAINKVFPTTNPSTVDCNALLIGMPRPYETNEINTSSNFYNAQTVLFPKPPECVCDKNDSLYSIFQALYGNDSIVPYTNWLNTTFNGSMSFDEVSELFSMCESSSCHYLTHGFVLPNVFSCKPCLTCDDINTGLNDFMQVFHNQIDSGAMDLFAQYMNNRYGYNLQLSDYMHMIQYECNITASYQTCDSLLSIYNYLDSAGYDKIPLAFLFDSVFNTLLPLNTWLDYLQVCDPTIDSIVPRINCMWLSSAYDHFTSKIDLNAVDNIPDSAANYFHFNYWPSYSKSSIYHYLVDTCNLINYDTVFDCRHYYELASLNWDTLLLYTEPWGSDSLFSWLHLNYYPEVSIDSLHALMDTCDFLPGIDTISCHELSIAYGVYLNVCPDDVSLQTWMNSYFALGMGYDSITYVGWFRHCGLLPETDLYLLCDSIPYIVYDSTFCVKELTEIARVNAVNSYQLYLDSINDIFNVLYFAACMNPALNFNVSADFNEYHYTLYYYDQGNNLVKTIPPAGVHLFSHDTILLVDTARKDPVNFSPIYSPHELATKYYYNTLNQLWKQYTPDADTAYFWYDRVGRLVVSQNAKQKNAISANEYSYTLYDNLSRTAEVGKINGLAAMHDSISRDSASLYDWILTGTREEVTSTYYDETVIPLAGFTQENLRNRVSSVTYETSYDSDTLTYLTGTHYCYDISGNVKSLIQENKLLESFGIQFKKRIDYEFDLVSGKVNTVCYQCDSVDQFMHFYEYDADNRLTQVKTSLDGINKEQEAQYQYYNHGSLARTEIGDRQVQGVDYAYNLQGWLKGVNSTFPDTLYDMGEDGVSSASNSQFGIDAYGFFLGYFNGDYKPIGTKLPEMDYQGSDYDYYSSSLYNGNIRNAVYGFTPNIFGQNGYSYSYDQLNRLINMNPYYKKDPENWTWMSTGPSLPFREQIQYDANGNIVTYYRDGEETLLSMDDLIYHYYPGTNKLKYVSDQVSSSNYPEDIDDQDTVNYYYDEIGNLIADSSEGLRMEWFTSGKISSIINDIQNTLVGFLYDPMGNRVVKAIFDNVSSEISITMYSRDAQGNVLATYQFDLADTSISYKLKDFSIYGSARLGVLKAEKVLYTDTSGTIDYSNNPVNFAEGSKDYELSNHLGNVMVTISDKKLPVDYDNDSIPDYFMSEVLSQRDYYPFGSPMPGRSFTSSNYQFGFNGMEQDDEVKGSGNSYDFGARIYDPRLGRWLSLDPLAKKYPGWSPYNFSLNNPVFYYDIDGRDVGAGVVVINKSEQPVILRGDGVQIQKLADGTSRKVNGDATWESGNDDIRDGFTLMPDQTFTSSKWESKDADGNTITHYGGSISDKDGNEVRKVNVFDVDYIDLDEGQEATIDRWYGEEKVSTKTHEEQKDGMFKGSGTTKGEIKVSISGDKDDPVKASLEISGKDKEIKVKDSGITNYDTDDK